METTKATTFKFSKQQTEMIDSLKERLGARSKSEVIRKAIALLQVASESSDDNLTITLVGRDGKERDILLS